MAVIASVRGGTGSKGARVVTGVVLKLNPSLKNEAEALGLDLMPKITQQIKSAVVRRSPVEFGTNKRSIRSAKVKTENGLHSIFSTTGYGG
ncbi:hypothetical protein LCGC14_2238250, partial [marine sediment metagenome]